MGERTLISFDYAVKYLLRSKADFGILSGFLSELMGRDVQVDDILESGSDKGPDRDAKTNISTTLNDRRVDLKARIDASTSPSGHGGEYAVFEIQFSREYDFLGRVLFGVSKAIIEQVESGNRYDIRKVYSINIAYTNMSAKREYMFYGKFGDFQGVHFKEESIPFAQAVGQESKEMTEIHPEYYLILPGMFDDELRSKFDEWVYILKHSDARDDFTAAGIEEAKVKLDLLKMSPAARKAYEKYLENRGSLDCAIITAKADGKAEGEEKGRAEGIAQGIAQGIAENQKKIVLNMRKKGFNATEIAEATELSENNVKDILN